MTEGVRTTCPSKYGSLPSVPKSYDVLLRTHYTPRPKNNRDFVTKVLDSSHCGSLEKFLSLRIWVWTVTSKSFKPLKNL